MSSEASWYVVLCLADLANGNNVGAGGHAGTLGHNSGGPCPCAINRNWNLYGLNGNADMLKEQVIQIRKDTEECQESRASTLGVT